MKRVSWLIGREFKIPLSLVTDDMASYPLLIIPDSALSENQDFLTKYLEDGGALLMSHDSRFRDILETPKDFPIFLGGVKDFCGKVFVNVSHPLARFFQYYSLSLGKSSLSVGLREVKSSPPDQTVIYLSEDGIMYPLLICGLFKASRYAIITLGDDEIEKSRCAPLSYLAALHYLLSDKPLVRISFWKEKKRAAAVLTFDFEGLAKYSDVKKYWWWNRRFDEILLRIGTSPILKFLKELEVPSTWFMLESQISKNPFLAKSLAKEKLIEIAGHGDVHQGIDKFAQRFDTQSKEIQSQRIANMKRLIKKILSIEVKGFRAPGLYANADTIKALQENDFEWDSSTSPQSDLRFREFPWPFIYVFDWEKEEIGRLVEIPIQAPWDRWCPLHGVFHSSKEYGREIKQGFEDIWFIGGIQVLLIHPYELPKYPGYWKAVKTHIKQLLRREDVEITTCGLIAQDWRQRDKADLLALFDEANGLIHVKVENGYPGLTLFVHIPERLRISKILADAEKQVPYTHWADLGGVVFSMKTGSEEFKIYLEPRTR